MKRKPKPRVVWLARDEFSEYSVFLSKPYLEPWGWGHVWVSPDNPEYQFCSDTFERVTGFSLKPGTCKRVRIRIEEVK